MAEMVVHYYDDTIVGVTEIHFSGSHAYHVRIFDSKVFQLAKDAASQIPVGKRNYDPVNFVWTLDGAYFNNKLLPFYSKAPMWFELKPYPTRIDWYIFLRLLKPDTKPRIKATDPDHVKAANFFNNFNVVVEQAVNTRGDKDTLVALTGVSDFSVIDRADSVTLKKLYRATAIRLHPDKNGGNHSDMSTFTQLWGIYVQPRI